MFWQIGGAVDATAPVRASAGSAPGRARAADLGLCYVPYGIRPRRVAHPQGKAGLQPVGPECHQGGDRARHRRPSPAAPSGRTSSRQLSPLSTMRRRAPEATDWPQIAALYEVLLRLTTTRSSRPTTPSPSAWSPNPGRPRAGPASRYPWVSADRPFYAVRGRLLVRAGHPAAALEAYRAAARVATNLQQQRYLNRQVARLQGRSAT
jgi:hypothetical protein